MIGFEPKVAEELGSYGRFQERLARFRADGNSFPVVRHHAWWLIHNLAAHSAIGLIPHPVTFRFHDWTSRKLNHA